MHDVLVRAGQYLPQPPAEIAGELPQETQWAMAAENLLSGTSTALNCLVLSVVSVEPISIKKVKSEINAMSDPRLPPVPLSDVRSAAKFTPFDVLDYDDEEDSLRLPEDKVSVSNFAAGLLEICLDTGLPVPLFSNATVPNRSWQSFVKLYSVRKAATVLKIGSSGNRGIGVRRLNDELGEYTYGTETLRQQMHALKAQGFIALTKRKNQNNQYENHALPKSELREAAQRFSGLLEMVGGRTELLDHVGDNARAKIRMARAAAHLNERSGLVTGTRTHVRLERNNETIVRYVAQHPDATTREIFDALGESLGYSSPDSLYSAMMRMTKTFPGQSIHKLPRSSRSARWETDK